MGTKGQDFTRLIKENKGIIYKVCNSYCAGKDDKDDLAQEIIYNLWKSFDSFNNEFKFSTWMYRSPERGNIFLSPGKESQTPRSYCGGTHCF